MSKATRNDGIIVNGGSINAGTLAVGRGARAISSGAEPASPPQESMVPPSASPDSYPSLSPLYERQWDAFISHASEDNAFVAPLARALQARGVTVWYDDVSLRVGSSLRESIDFALIRSRYGIVVFSRHYFSKNWTRQEINGLLSREIGGLRVILPIWHNVSPAEVVQFSSILADRVAARSSEDLQVIVEKLAQVIRGPQDPRLNG